jgi:hypothetical protein
MMASMLIGHGGYGLVMGKPHLLHCYDVVGLGGFGVALSTVSTVIGGFEMLLGVFCLGATWPAFFLFVCIWKLSTEGLFVPAQAYGAWWEVLEHSGSDAAPLLGIGVQHKHGHDILYAGGELRRLAKRS